MADNQKKRGVFTISLDFELYWGMRDVVTIEAYRDNLEGTSTAVNEMLALFEKYHIHVTWAIVGFLFFRNEEELRKNLPIKKPAYNNNAFNLYDYIKKSKSLYNSYHFAPDLISKIINTPFQELATHTFSHYYCLEEGQSIEEFQEDISLAQKTAFLKAGIQCSSLVFPRNQCNEAYLPVLAENGIIAYRGNEPHWIYQESDWNGRILFRRALKLLDSYINISGHHTVAIDKLKQKDGVLNIPSSRFLRPFSEKISFLDFLKLRRIKKSMTYAAQKGEIFHLWWHPHNFGKDTHQNILFLEQILCHYKFLSRQYGMESLHMQEIAGKFRQ